MSSITRDESVDRKPELLWETVDKIKHSALLSLALFGVLMLLTGAALQTGVWAAMLAIWGGGLILVGGIGYGIIWWKRQ